MAAVSNQNQKWTMVTSPNGQEVPVDHINKEYETLGGGDGDGNSGGVNLLRMADLRDRIVFEELHVEPVDANAANDKAADWKNNVKSVCTLYAAIDKFDYSKHGYVKVGQIWHNSKSSAQVAFANTMIAKVAADIKEAKAYLQRKNDDCTIL